MLHEGIGEKLLMFLPLSGLVSGLLTNILVSGAQEAPLFSGVIFGLFLVVGLLVSGMLSRIEKATVLIAASTATYFFRFSRPLEYRFISLKSWRSTSDGTWASMNPPLRLRFLSVGCSADF